MRLHIYVDILLYPGMEDISISAEDIDTKEMGYVRGEDVSISSSTVDMDMDMAH